MSANVRPFAWTEAREAAAALLAEGKLADAQIAARAGVTDRQLRRWKLHPEFAARVEEVVVAIRAALVAKGIAAVENRLDDYGELRRLHFELIRARRDDPRMKGVAGGSTGLLVATPRLIKVYESDAVDEEDASLGAPETLAPNGHSRVVYEYAYDAAPVKALLEIDKQAAIELRQWPAAGARTQFNIDPSQLTDEQLERIANGDDPLQALLGR